MNGVRELVEGSYTNFQQQSGITGIDIMNTGLIILGSIFGIVASYIIYNTLTEIKITDQVFTQKNFLIGCIFIVIAVVVAWALWIFVLPLFPLSGILAGRALGILWIIPAFLGVGYLNEWRKINLKTPFK